MKAFVLTTVAITLSASPALATTADVYFSIRGEGFDSATGAPVPLDSLNSNSYLIWTVSVRVTGDNQGLGGCLVSFGIKSLATNEWAPHTMDHGGLGYPAVYTASGAEGRIGSAVDTAANGGMGAYRGACLGWPDSSVFFIDQMGVGYLEWKARRYKTLPPPPGWVGEQVWGIGLDSRKSVILAAGTDGTYDLFQGSVDLSAWAEGSYRAAFDLTLMQAKVMESGVNLDTDQSSVPMISLLGGYPTDPRLQVGQVFEFMIIPEPGTLFLLAGATFLARRRRN